MKELKKYAVPISMFMIFETIAVVLWIALDNIFYLFNFSYIGICLSGGLFLYIKKFKYSRLMIQFLLVYICLYIGGYKRKYDARRFLVLSYFRCFWQLVLQ